MNNKARQVFESMINKGILPETGVFEITNEIIDSMYSVWKEVHPPLRSEVSRKKTKNEKNLSRKINGINLMELNEERFLRSNENKTKEVKNKLSQQCGFVYLISNPSFDGMYKIGMTSDLNNRLRSYQTYDPHRRFKVENYKFVMDRRKAEKELLETFHVNIVNGEWISHEKAKEIFIDMN